MTRGNSPIHPPNNNFFIQQCSDTSIKPQRNSDYDASVGLHDLESSGLYQIANRHGNTGVKDNDDSESFETHRENNCSSFCFGDTIITTHAPLSSIIPPP